MKNNYALALSALSLLIGSSVQAHEDHAPKARTAAQAASANCAEWLNQSYTKLRSRDTVNLCTLAAGKPLLIVNTASHCGFTRQFAGLQALHQKYAARGLVVVGFPSNDFFQENADEAKTAEICYQNYGVTFTMLKESSVKGASANATFKMLAERSGAPKWNFNKYLVGAGGSSVQHFESTVEPDAKQLTDSIDKLLSINN